MSNLPVHPEFESRYDALGDLSNPDGWVRRASVFEGSFLRTNPEPIFRRSNWFWDAVGITTRASGSDLLNEITSAATSPHHVAEAHIVALPARLSRLIDTNATGKACALYKRANRGAMDGTSIGTNSKELATRQWLSRKCSAVIDEIHAEREASMGGAGPRLKILHKDIVMHLDRGSDDPETRREFDRRWLQWHCDKQEYVEDIIKKSVDGGRVDYENRVKRKRVFEDLQFMRNAAEKARAGEEEEEVDANDWIAARERQVAEDFIRDEEEAREKREEDLAWFLHREEILADQECWLEPELHEPMVEVEVEDDVNIAG